MKILLTLLALSLTSCGLLKKLGHHPKPAPTPQKPAGRQILGRIASVSEVGKFVLIQKYGPGRLPKNTLFHSHGISGSQASLRPTGERVRDFFAADIITGTALKGDAVTGLPLIKEKPKTTPIEGKKLEKEADEDTPNE